MPLFLLLLIVPLIEIFLFIKVGGAIGVWWTIGIVILTAIIGTLMLRRQGLAALRNVQSRLAAGENPGRMLADGAMILVAGVLLLTPGFLTDTLGFLLLVPAVRGLLWHRLAPRLTVVSVQSRRTTRAWPGGGAGGVTGAENGGATVEGDYEEVDPETGSETGPEREDGPARPIGHDTR